MEGIFITLEREIMNDSNEGATRELPEGAVAVLNEGNTVIVVDDHSYVIENWNGTVWGTSAWIFPEAVLVIKGLPDNPDDAENL